jgi:hypothetical protein
VQCPVGTVEFRQVVYGLHMSSKTQPRPVGTIVSDSTVPTGRYAFNSQSLQAVNDLPNLNRRYATTKHSSLRDDKTLIAGT